MFSYYWVKSWQWFIYSGYKSLLDVRPHENAHVSIHSTYKHITFYVKNDFADVIKFKDLEMGSLPWIIWGTTRHCFL